MTEVLIVEDAPLQKALIQQFLRPEHTVVGVVETEKTAIEFIARHEPAAVVLDLALAEGDGVGVVEYIDAHDIESRVVISTATVTDEIKQAVDQRPVDAYLVKPYSKEELCTAVAGDQ